MSYLPNPPSCTLEQPPEICGYKSQRVLGAGLLSQGVWTPPWGSGERGDGHKEPLRHCETDAVLGRSPLQADPSTSLAFQISPALSY